MQDVERKYVKTSTTLQPEFVGGLALEVEVLATA